MKSNVIFVTKIAVNGVNSYSESGVAVDVFGFVFRVYDGLIFVQAIIAGYRITYCHSNQIIGDTVEAKKFKCDQDRGNWTVGHTAE